MRRGIDSFLEQDFGVSVAPPGVYWNPAVPIVDYLKLVGDDQYHIDFDGDNVAEDIQYTYGSNLCGQLSSAYVLAILSNNDNHIKGVINAVNKIYGKQGGNDNHKLGTDQFDLAKAIVTTAYKKGVYGVRAKAYAYEKTYLCSLNSLNSNPHTDAFDYDCVGTLDRPVSHYDTNNPQHQQQISNQLAIGHHHIALVEMLKSNTSLTNVNYNTDPNVVSKYTAHWVVITGFSSEWDHNSLDSKMNWVRIFNPFYNRQEYYLWKNFRNYMHAGISLEVW